MRKLDKNQKIGLVSLAVFVLFLIVFSVLSNLVQSEIVPDFTLNQRFQGILVFAMFLPLCTAMFFGGKHFKSKNRKIGSILLFVSVTLFIFGVMQALLSLLEAYGS